MPDKQVYTIKIRRRKDSEKKSEKTKSTSKGVLRSKSRRDGFDRRRVGGFINFYDLAQLKIGSAWVQNNFVFVPTLGVQLTGTPDTWIIVRTSDLTLTIIRNFEATILIEGVDNFKSKFRKVLKSVGKAFPIKITGVGSNDLSFEYRSVNSYGNWTDQGFKFSMGVQSAYKSLVITPEIDGEPINKNFEGRFPPFYLGPLEIGRSKVTTVPDFSGPVVAYTMTNGDDVFLMPHLGQHIGFQETLESGSPYLTQWNDVDRIKPRNFENQNALFEYDVTNLGSVDANYTEVRAATPDVRVSRILKFTPTAPPITSSTFAPDPPPIAIGNGPVVISYSYSSLPVHIGRLCAVVRRKSSTFYIWQEN